VYHLVSRKINLDRTASFFRFIRLAFGIEPVFPGPTKNGGEDMCQKDQYADKNDYGCNILH
jgi:hypothetical protein